MQILYRIFLQVILKSLYRVKSDFCAFNSAEKWWKQKTVNKKIIHQAVLCIHFSINALGLIG